MKKLMALVLVLVCVLGLAGCAGGEISFEASINRVEDGIAYATVLKDNAGFGSKKLPESIIFNIGDLEVELKAGDIIYGNYLRGTIDGQTVQVINCKIIEPAE